jgi:hypothetical protein
MSAHQTIFVRVLKLEGWGTGMFADSIEETNPHTIGGCMLERLHAYGNFKTPTKLPSTWSRDYGSRWILS